MELKYVYSESTVKPAEVEIGKRTVYIRKDIIEEERTDEFGNVTLFWTYQEAKLSHDEFNKYSSDLVAMNAIKGVNDSDNINLIIQNNMNTKDNQYILMEAIADLYDMIASLS